MGDTREQAIGRMRIALSEMAVGHQTNAAASGTNARRQLRSWLPAGLGHYLDPRTNWRIAAAGQQRLNRMWRSGKPAGRRKPGGTFRSAVEHGALSVSIECRRGYRDERPQFGNLEMDQPGSGTWHGRPRSSTPVDLAPKRLPACSRVDSSSPRIRSAR